MNKDTAKDFLPLVQAMADGKTIQLKHARSGWTDVKVMATYIEPDNYRIKPEPREVYVIFNTDGVVINTWRKEENAVDQISRNPGWTYKKFVEVM